MPGRQVIQPIDHLGPSPTREGSGARGSPPRTAAGTEEKESKLVTIKQIRQERQLWREPGGCDQNLGVGGCCYGFVPLWIGFVLYGFVPNGFVIFVFLKMMHTMCVFVVPTKQMITRRRSWHFLGSGKMWP